MNRPKYRKFLIPLVAFFLVISFNSFTQEYKFKRLGILQGICHPFVYTVNQDKNGYIWTGTGEGLCRFNGFEFSTGGIPDTLANDVVVTSFKDSHDNLWFGFQNGTISLYTGTEFLVPEIKGEIRSSVTGFTEAGDGKVLAASMNNGILVFENYREVTRYEEGMKNSFISCIFVSDDILLAGSQNGLEIYSLKTMPEQPVKLFSVNELSYIKIQDIKKSVNREGFWLATEDAGAYYLTLADNHTYTLKKVGESAGVGNLNVQSVFEDEGSNLWLSTLRNGVFKITDMDRDVLSGRVMSFNKNNGLTSDYIKQVFEDREGNIWIATYGEGLALLLNEAFTFYGYQGGGLNNNITSVAVSDNFLWLGFERGLLRADASSPADKHSHRYIKNLPADEITSLLFDQDKTIWIGTGKSGIFRLNIPNSSVSPYFYGAASLGRSVNSLAGNHTVLYAATRDGIYYFSLAGDKSVHYTTSTGLPHNDIKHVFIDSENNLLYATHSNAIEEINIIGELDQLYKAGDLEIDFNSIAQDVNGNIWASTYGSGVFYFSPDSIINITSADGMKSDYAYGLISADDESIWVGHRLGISRINVNDFSIEIYDVDKGILGDCNPNAVFKDRLGKLYFGTTEGLVVYDPSKDKKSSVPPKTNISRVIINEVPHDFLSEIVLPFSRYKIRMEYIGINFHEPEAVRYQYKLEGYDSEWSDLTDLNYVIYPRVQEGRYTFLVRSFNKYGQSDETPASFRLRIKLPFYKTWWFILVSAGVLVLTVWFIIKFRERKQKQLQEFLEKSLAERTREVVEQKEEIEIKNRDITDSINYAQRIQASILPPIKRLQNNFDGAFVFYQPRDIVSGDFYWYDKISETKFIIVCADSTGHGVPGAFMSMIGTTLIKDICSREETRAPSDILRSLDVELRNTLNQNLEAEKANDGMDIIVCEIDLKSFYIRYASAMRPMIIYKDSEEVYIKGSRSSVGGHYDKSEKEFQDEGIQLSRGDIVYMFSDGYPDQFGGPMGKKFKMVRLKNLLQDINQKPMEEQFNYVKSTFLLWKEDYPQVDDVLFMGIKL